MLVSMGVNLGATGANSSAVWILNIMEWCIRMWEAPFAPYQ